MHWQLCEIANHHRSGHLPRSTIHSWENRRSRRRIHEPVRSYHAQRVPRVTVL